MRFFVRTMIIAGIAAGVLGCQSGPHWPQKFAWWKHDPAPEDTSAIARSVAPLAPEATVAKTAPPLPSTQSTPQAMAAAGLEGATPPSMANLAATKPPAVAPTAPAGVTAATPQAGVASPPLAASPPPSTAVPPNGPYDPSAYRPNSGLATSTSGPNDDLTAVPDRYGLAASAPPTATTSAPVSAAQNSPASAVPAVPQTGDRYATLPDRYSQNPAAPPAPATNSAVPPEVTIPQTVSAQTNSPAPHSLGSPGAARATVNPTPDRYSAMGAPTSTSAPASSIPQSPVAAPPAATTVVGGSVTPPSTPIKLTSAPGQYRPGGTSSYGASPVSSTQIEVANRPQPTAPPAPTPASTALPTPTAPAPGSYRY